MTRIVFIDNVTRMAPVKITQALYWMNLNQ